MKKLFYFLMFLFIFTSCQKDDIFNKYKNNSVDSTFNKKLKLYELVDKKTEKKEVIKKKKRFNFRNFLKLKFRKD